MFISKYNVHTTYLGTLGSSSTFGVLWLNFLVCAHTWFCNINMKRTSPPKQYDYVRTRSNILLVTQCFCFEERQVQLFWTKQNFFNWSSYFSVANFWPIASEKKAFHFFKKKHILFFFLLYCFPFVTILSQQMDSFWK